MMHLLASLLQLQQQQQKQQLQQPARAPATALPAPQFGGTRELYRTWAPSFRAWLRSQDMPLPREDMTAAESLALADVLLLVVPEKDKDVLLTMTDDGWRMWEQLRQRYTRVTQAYIESLQRRLEHTQLINATGVRNYCDRIQRTISELELAHDEHWTEQRRITAYLHGLGPRFDSVREWVANLEREELTLARVLRRLENKGDALVAKERRDRARMGRTASGNQQAQKATVMQARVMQCYRCGADGHIARSCTYAENVCYKCKSPGHVQRQCPMSTHTGSERAAAVQDSNEEDECAPDELVYAVNAAPDAQTAALTLQQGAWLVDSGATRCMTGDRNMFVGQLRAAEGRVQVAKAGEMLHIQGAGDVSLDVSTDRGVWRYTFEALYVPGLAHNLLATCDVVGRGGRVVLSSTPCIELDGYRIECERFGRQTMLLSAEHACIAQSLLHRRLSHSDRQRCTKLAERLGIKVTGRTSDVCEPCAAANMRRAPLPRSSSTVVENTLDYVAVDTEGPLTRSIDGYIYLLLYVDYATDYVFDYYLRRKSEAAATIDRFVRDAGGTPKTLRTDGAGDLCHGEAEQRWILLGVKLDQTARASPEQNGRIERKLTVVTEHMRAMLTEAMLPPEFWTYAARTACVTLNMFLTTALGREETPYKMFTGRDPDLSRLRVFGAKAWVHDPGAKMRGKLCDRAVPAVFVGYQQGMKGWKFYLPDTGAVIKSRDARFLEDVPGGTLIQELPSTDDANDEDYVDDAPEETQGDDDTATEQHESGRPRRATRAPAEWWRAHVAQASVRCEDEAPKSYRQAMTSTKRVEWQEAIQEELDNHAALKTYELVSKQPSMKLLTGGWRFTVKNNQAGDGIRYKARLFARGCAQTADTYDIISSPVASLVVMRLMIAQADRDGWQLAHVDVKAAYLNAPLKEQIYMRPVPGMQAPPDTVCRLTKAWPGLRQAGVCWWQELQRWMSKQQFTQSRAEQCIFVKEDARVSTWVDDLLWAFRDEAAQ